MFQFWIVTAAHSHLSTCVLVLSIAIAMMHFSLLCKSKSRNDTQQTESKEKKEPNLTHKNKNVYQDEGVVKRVTYRSRNDPSCVFFFSLGLNADRLKMFAIKTQTKWMVHKWDFHVGRFSDCMHRSCLHLFPFVFLSQKFFHLIFVWFFLSSPFIL